MFNLFLSSAHKLKSKKKSVSEVEENILCFIFRYKIERETNSSSAIERNPESRYLQHDISHEISP